MFIFSEILCFNIHVNDTHRKVIVKNILYTSLLSNEFFNHFLS